MGTLSMPQLSKRHDILVISLGLTTLYFLWVSLFADHYVLRTFGSNIFSIISIVVAFLWLVPSIKLTTSDRALWCWLLFGTGSILIAEIIWFTYESIFKINVPYPGLHDVFYLLQLFGYLMAVGYKVVHPDRKYSLIKFLLDLSMIMVVLISLAWYFLIEPLVFDGEIRLFEIIVSVIYPVGDVLLLFGLLMIYYVSSYLHLNKALRLLLIGVAIQIIADVSYLYMMIHYSYDSGSWIDPLFSLAVMLIAGSFYYRDDVYTRATDTYRKKRIRHYILPYVNVFLLLILLVIDERKDTVLLMGAMVTFILVVARQIFVILENHYLVQAYEKKTIDLAISEQRYKSLFHYHPDAVFSIDSEGYFTSVNDVTCQWFKRSKEELIGTYSLVVLKNSDRDQLIADKLKLYQGETKRYQCQLESAADHRIIQLTVIPILVEEIFTGMFGIGKDITAEIKEQKQVKKLAYYDSLTGLKNRSAFHYDLNHGLLNHRERPFYIGFLDLDNFKAINDTLGHHIGDRLLIDIAQRLKLTIKSYDQDAVIARLGGDEFTFIVHASSEDVMQQLAQQLVNVVETPVIIKETTVFTSPSIGISHYPTNGDTLEELIQQADKAMYHVKSSSKCGYKFAKDLSVNNTLKINEKHPVYNRC